MKSALEFGLATGSLLGLLLVGSPAQAQRAGFAAAERSMAAPVHPSYSRRFVGHAPLSSASHEANRVASGDFGLAGSGLTLQQLLCPIPPPGFDYQYLSAIDGDLAEKALVDPVTQARLAEARRFLRGRGFGAGGYYILDGGGYDWPDESDESQAAEQPPAAQPQQPPQIIVLQQPPAESESSSEAAPAQQPLPDVGEFILVLRNGTRIQAVAFSRTDNGIVYITSDGSRRTIALADLDSAATVRVNEERGTPLQL